MHAVASAQPCIVLSNDDGVESPALQSLASRLRGEGHRVMVVAPAGNKSAASMGLTLRLDMELRARPDLGPDTFALTGTPTDCMMVALDATKGLLRALSLHPVLALSGPNYGPNCATDVLLSGTVGAARTAGLYGVPAMAVSSTNLDKSSRLDNAVEAALTMARMALTTLGGPAAAARNWPRNHIIVGAPGRRHVTSSCEYDALPPGWVLDLEQVLLDAFADGDVFLNLNVPSDWQPGRSPIQTTGLGLMFYKDSYVVRVPGQETVAARGATPAGEAAAAQAAAATVRTQDGAAAAETAAEPRIADAIAQALAAGLPITYNNAYDTRRVAPVDRSDVMALARGEACITTLQTWPEGHTLCLSDRIMARSLLADHKGFPVWLGTRAKQQ